MVCHIAALKPMAPLRVPPLICVFSVGMTGFEPATLRSQSECATKLRHIP